MKLAIHAAAARSYREGQAKPSDVVAEVYDRIGRETQPVWISLIPRETALARARELESDPAAAGAAAVRDSFRDQRQYRSGWGADNGGVSGLCLHAATQRDGGGEVAGGGRAS